METPSWPDSEKNTICEIALPSNASALAASDRLAGVTAVSPSTGEVNRTCGAACGWTAMETCMVSDEGGVPLSVPVTSSLKVRPPAESGGVQRNTPVAGSITAPSGFPSSSEKTSPTGLSVSCPETRNVSSLPATTDCGGSGSRCGI